MSLANVALRGGNVPEYFSFSGKVYTSSDASSDALVTGQTSFANTTPTFMIDVPDGTVIVPLEVSLTQGGTVAGGTITVLIEKDDADRYNTGGTAETIYNDFGNTGSAVLYSGATANAGYGVRLYGQLLAPEVTPTAAEAPVPEILWTPGRTLDIIKGPGAFLVFTYAGTTGPSWFWTIKWAEFNEADL